MLVYGKVVFLMRVEMRFHCWMVFELCRVVDVYARRMHTLKETERERERENSHSTTQATKHFNLFVIVCCRFDGSKHTHTHTKRAHMICVLSEMGRTTLNSITSAAQWTGNGFDFNIIFYYYDNEREKKARHHTCNNTMARRFGSPALFSLSFSRFNSQHFVDLVESQCYTDYCTKNTHDYVMLASGAQFSRNRESVFENFSNSFMGFENFL